MLRITTIIIIFCTLLYASWSTVGPYGGYTYSLAGSRSNPLILYVAEYGNPSRVFRTTDGGQNWVHSGSVGNYIFALVVDPSSPDICYACGPGSDVYKTADGGRNWVSRQTDVQVLNSLSIDPSNSATIYAVGYKLYGGENRMAVCKSTDSGNSWNSITFDSTWGYGFAVAVDPVSTNIVYAGGYVNLETRLYKSTDCGNSWFNITGSLTDYYPSTIAIHPRLNNILIVGTYYGGIFKSTNGGQIWNQTLNCRGIQSITISSPHPDLIYASSDSFLYRSTDQGLNWQPIGSSIEGHDFRTIVADPAQAEIVFTHNDFGVFKSTDRGINWHETHKGVTLGAIPVIALAPSSPEIIWAYSRNNNSMYKTIDAGQSWSRIPSFLDCGEICGVGIHPQNPDIVYVLEGQG